MKLRIKELRDEKGITQAKLSEKSGISRVYIAKIENSDDCGKVGTDVLIALADAFEVKVDDLFCK